MERLLPLVGSVCLKISLGKVHLEGLGLLSYAIHLSIFTCIQICLYHDDYVSVPRWKLMPGKLFPSSVKSLTGDRSQVLSGRWHRWQVTGERQVAGDWQVIHVAVTGDRWPVTGDRQQVKDKCLYIEIKEVYRYVYYTVFVLTTYIDSSCYWPQPFSCQNCPFQVLVAWRKALVAKMYQLCRLRSLLLAKGILRLLKLQVNNFSRKRSQVSSMINLCPCEDTTSQSF